MQVPVVDDTGDEKLDTPVMVGVVSEDEVKETRELGGPGVLEEEKVHADPRSRQARRQSRFVQVVVGVM